MTQPALSHDASPDLRSAFAADVRAGLTHTPQKELPSKYLYDEVGSALFEVITALPEYGVTRAEERVLTKHAADIVAASAARRESRRTRQRQRPQDAPHSRSAV